MGTSTESSSENLYQSSESYEIPGSREILDQSHKSLSSLKWDIESQWIEELENLELRPEDFSINWNESEASTDKFYWKPWELKYERQSSNWEYYVYSYKINNGVNMSIFYMYSVINHIRQELNLKSFEWIILCNEKWAQYFLGDLFRLKPWDKFYIKVPVNASHRKNNGRWNNIDTQIENNSSWDNPDYFNSNKRVETDNKYKDRWIILKRDVWMSFYLMQPKDIKYINGKPSRTETIKYLIQKLWAIPEFSYLKRSEYTPKDDDVTKTFNIRKDFAQYLKQHPNSYFIPIPMESAKRKVEDKKFKNYARKWIDEICERDEPYGKYWKWIKDKEKLAAFFTAIAKVETWQTVRQIWSDEYHRRESNWHDCFSFGPHHILMEWAWKTSFNVLKNNWYFSTEWQVYHPKNSTMRCMWFIVEKLKGHKDIAGEINKMLSFFNKSNVTWNDFRNFAEMYNGKYYANNNYHNNFATAFNSVK